VAYADALQEMRDLARRRIAGEVPDTLLLLEHPPVFTTGRRTDPAHLLLADRDIEAMGAELHRVERGGSVTFHGPGQLVGYPIVRMRAGVREYVRDLQEVVIHACADVGVAVTPDDEVGVWAGDRKVCAIGIRASRRVAWHGFALNCTTDLSWYGAIVPCGLEDRGVTRLSDLAGREVTVEEMTPIVARRFAEVFELELVAGDLQLAAG